MFLHMSARSLLSVRSDCSIKAHNACLIDATGDPSGEMAWLDFEGPCWIILHINKGKTEGTRASSSAPSLQLRWWFSKHQTNESAAQELSVLGDKWLNSFVNQCYIQTTPHMAFVMVIKSSFKGPRRELWRCLVKFAWSRSVSLTYL